MARSRAEGPRQLLIRDNKTKMKILKIVNERSITLEFSHDELKELVAAAAAYYDSLATCTAPIAAREVIRPLLESLIKAEESF